jgi:DMSO/TMAO reductase YedYZ molybdopterin-dependent catalytic subunit
VRLSRRQWLVGATAAGVALLPAGCAPRAARPASSTEPLARFPGKVPMRVVNDRPPCLETPWRYFRDDITLNEAFYVRWHLQAIPTADLATWRLRVDGAVDRPLELSMTDLQRLGGDEVIAVNQCSGNSRGLFSPRVAGAQWRNGGMGNARWGGVSLAKLLRQAGVKKEAVQVAFDGLDEGSLSSIPDYIKALDVDRAMQPEVTIAYSMNNEPIPVLNGFPARLVVPGWYATYWVKGLHRITVLPKVFDGFWMAKAYKLPTTPNGNEDPKQLAANLVPISRLNVRSFFTTPDPDAEVPAGRPCELDGIAFDGGSGIQKVEVSADGGSSWSSATLGGELGHYSFRRWRLAFTPPGPGEYRLRVRATSRDGQTQPDVAGWNRSGYMRNVIEELPLRVV